MKNILSVVFLIVAVLFITACGSKETKTSTSLPTVPPAVSANEESSQIDYVALQKSLGLERTKQDLGFAEKAFDTCQVGFGYSSNKYCHREVFVVLHFQILCRDSEGTVSEGINNADMTALSDRSVKWNLKGISGTVKTDGEGYGQIQTVSPISQKSQRVKLTASNEFLYMRANEITKVVTPKPWCNR